MPTDAAASRSPVCTASQPALTGAASGIRQHERIASLQRPDRLDARGAFLTHKSAKTVGRFRVLTVINKRGANSATRDTMEASPMSYRMKITLPDPTMAQLEALAEQRGEPASRVAAQLICAGVLGRKGPETESCSDTVPVPKEEPDPDRRTSLDRAVLQPAGMASPHVGLDRGPTWPLPEGAGASEGRLVG